jgi:hypothetical protein
LFGDVYGQSRCRKEDEAAQMKLDKQLPYAVKKRKERRNGLAVTDCTRIGKKKRKRVVELEV